MVLSYYGLKEPPFGFTPDPRYLFASATHREALASILYGIESGVGFIALTALPGMGKTTLLFEALGTIKRTAVTAFLFQTITTPADLLKALLADLGAEKPDGGMMELQAQLNQLLSQYSAEGKRIVVVIDEAQNLDDSVLEMVRMLSNFESSREKFLQIVLSGQPQLAKRLAEPQLLQLRQRISIWARLAPLSISDVGAYIEHRLHIAGYDGDKTLFTNPAVDLIAQHSGGIPRNINNLCFNALSIGCAVKSSRIGQEIIQEVIRDLDIGLDQNPMTNAAVALGTGAAEISKSPAWAPALLARSGTGLTAFWKIAAVALVVAVLSGLCAWYFARRNAGPGAAAASPANVGPASPGNAQPALPAAVRGTNAPDTVNAASVNGAGNGTGNGTGGDLTAPRPAVTTAVAPSIPTPSHVPEKGRWVTAERGQTLRRICLQNFGICEPVLYKAIRDANPWITNPNRVKPKQRVFLPELPTTTSRLKELHDRFEASKQQAPETQ